MIYTDSDTSRSYTYAQVRSVAIDFGTGLKAQWGWKKGDVLAFYTPNCIDTPAITWGTHWAGGIVSPANPSYTPDELAFQLKDAGAKALVTQKPFLKAACEAAKKAGLPEDRIILMGDEKDESGRFKHFLSIRNISGASRYRRTKADPKKDLAFLVYSSGTTGHPKGVMLSHENIVSNVLMLKVGEAGNLKWNGGKDGQGDKLLAFLPFFHIYVNCPLSSLSIPEQITDRGTGPHVLNPPKHIHWSPAGSYGQVRPRVILQAHPTLRHNFRICRSSRGSLIGKVSYCGQI